MQKKLLIVSNRLPLTIEKSTDGIAMRQSSGGLISAVNAYLASGGKDTFTEKIWVGVPGCQSETWEESGISQLPSTYSYLPVFVTEERYDLYYNGFSNSVLWPLFHYFPSYADYNAAFFEAYIDVNRQFCDLLSASIKPGDVVWIHDYHLLPLAGMLRERFPELTIGLFLHIPFPSFELFRVIPKQWQREILKGMLGADLVGLHTADYVSHFMKAVSSSLYADSEGLYVNWQNRRVKVDAFPISIDFERFDSALKNDAVTLLREKYIHLKGDKKMLFSVDRLDYTKGIYNRLVAFEQFITAHPNYKGKVVFILVIVPSRDTIAKYAEGRKIIDEYIGNINSTMGEIGWQPIIYQYGHLEFDELLALYTTCDLALITPLRDGMNLVAKEFVASRSDERGVLVLSEMAGAASELGDALSINPNDTKEIAEAIKNGLEMNEEEQAQRLVAMRERVRTYDVQAWAIDFFSEMEKIKSEQLKLGIRFIDSFTKVRLLDDYAHAKTRLILIDYDGTLVPFAKDPSLARPSKELIMLLAELNLPQQNHVYVISGRDSATLEDWLGNLDIGLIAEHGAKMRKQDKGWKQELELRPQDWISDIKKIMQRFVAKIPKSFIETKEFSVAWHYRKSDAFLGGNSASDLIEELLRYTASLPLDVLDGNKVIEVRNKGINKGKAVEKLLSKQPDYDFILCIGDDRTDEDMFKVLETLPQAYTIKIGSEASFAKFNLHTSYLAVELLSTICQYPRVNF